jgi:hypothetical protein
MVIKLNKKRDTDFEELNRGHKGRQIILVIKISNESRLSLRLGSRVNGEAAVVVSYLLQKRFAHKFPNGSSGYSSVDLELV